MTNASSWRPLITGAAAEPVWESIEAIADALRDPDAGYVEARSGAGTLAGGAAGISLFYSYLAEARDSEGAAEADADTAGVYLDRAFDSVANQPLSLGLYSGFTGIAWVARHLEGRLLEEDEDGESTEEIDEAVLAALAQDGWPGDYDLIGGLVGVGVYALEGLPRPRARAALVKIIDHLEAMVQPAGAGRSWYTGPHLLPPHQLEICPEGYYNLGLAHGVPAVLALLAASWGAGVEKERVQPLLESGVDWLLGEELEPEKGSRFPSWVGKGAEGGASRAAWCYGDPGLALSLLLAGQQAGNAAWQEQALRILRHSAARDLERSGVRDAGLCHGAAGLVHLFNRAFQASGDEVFAEAARYWVDQTLALRRDGEGVGGYLAWAPDHSGDLDWRPEGGFLTGAGGVAMALLATVSSVEPNWDRVLMTNVAPAASNGDAG